MARGRKINIAAKTEAETALLDAATQLLKSHSYKEISLRELAQLADQNVAMISYYFGSKEKLFIELITRKLSEPEKKIKHKLVGNSDELSPSLRIKHILKRFMEMHKNNPWIAGFILDNVLASESKIREEFVDKVLKKNAKTLSAAIQDLQTLVAENQETPPVNEKLLIISIISLVAFPFVASPVLNDAFNFDIRNTDLDEWVEHNYQLLIARFGPNVTNLESVI